MVHHLVLRIVFDRYKLVCAIPGVKLQLQSIILMDYFTYFELVLLWSYVAAVTPAVGACLGGYTINSVVPVAVPRVAITTISCVQPPPPPPRHSITISV